MDCVCGQILIGHEQNKSYNQIYDVIYTIGLLYRKINILSTCIDALVKILVKMWKTVIRPIACSLSWASENMIAHP